MPSIPRIVRLAYVVLLLLLRVSTVRAAEKPEPPTPTTRAAHVIEGWTVRIDGRLLQPPNEVLGTRAIKQLEASLANIRGVVAADRLAQLQSVGIVLDFTHGKLHSEQYHPGEGWLTENGYAKDLAKCVHIPDAAYYTAARHHNEQPWATMHELAHAYHDQVFGFDEPRIKKAWEQYKASGHGDSVLHINGSKGKHYALTNPMEFFAEMSEAYFGSNDFFPFNRAELKIAEPEIHALLETIWGRPFQAGGDEKAKASTRPGTKVNESPRPR